MRTACSALVVVTFALALGACGEYPSNADSTPAPTQSAADAAKTSVCAARDDIAPHSPSFVRSRRPPALRLETAALSAAVARE